MNSAHTVFLNQPEIVLASSCLNTFLLYLISYLCRYWPSLPTFLFAFFANEKSAKVIFSLFQNMYLKKRETAALQLIIRNFFSNEQFTLTNKFVIYKLKCLPKNVFLRCLIFNFIVVQVFIKLFLILIFVFHINCQSFL